MRLRAHLYGFALAFFALLPLPSAGEVACIAREDLPLIYSPDEPPVCPTPMAELVPSTVGRPPDFSAVELASCAGLWDAVVILQPDAVTEPGFIDPELLFELAKARRERPPLAELVEIRKAARELDVDFLQDPEWRNSDVVPHAFSYCNGVKYRATGQ